jgi:hypothetical protein
MFSWWKISGPDIDVNILGSWSDALSSILIELLEMRLLYSIYSVWGLVSYQRAVLTNYPIPPVWTLPLDNLS